jgi:hypothetical protein
VVTTNKCNLLPDGEHGQLAQSQRTVTCWLPSASNDDALALSSGEARPPRCENEKRIELFWENRSVDIGVRTNHPLEPELLFDPS